MPAKNLSMLFDSLGADIIYVDRGGLAISSSERHQGINKDRL